MSGPLQGIRVVELGVWVAGPAARRDLADWGAEVIKIEPPTGDPFRGLFSTAAGIELPTNPPFELDNRGKRSIALDLRTTRGARSPRRCSSAPTSSSPTCASARSSALGLDYAALHARNPRLVYCRVTGYGRAGRTRDRPAYDVGAFWSRAGVGRVADAAGRRPAAAARRHGRSHHRRSPR